jgi:hypothetical protein
MKPFEVVLGEFSTLSWTVLLQIKINGMIIQVKVVEQEINL